MLLSFLSNMLGCPKFLIVTNVDHRKWCSLISSVLEQDHIVLLSGGGGGGQTYLQLLQNPFVLTRSDPCPENQRKIYKGSIVVRTCNENKVIWSFTECVISNSSNRSNLSILSNLSSCEKKAWKEIQAWTGFEPMTSAMPVQCSSSWAIKPTESWSYYEFFLAYWCLMNVKKSLNFATVFILEQLT